LTERHNQVAFEVDRRANKYQIRDAVEYLYPAVKVEKVRTMIVPGKKKRRGVTIGKQPHWKKAVVSLRQGDVIDFFAAE
jgi:large subunit ribosomal protein L23